jgi:hypothetical protein
MLRVVGPLVVDLEEDLEHPLQHRRGDSLGLQHLLLVRLGLRHRLQHKAGLEDLELLHQPLVAMEPAAHLGPRLRLPLDLPRLVDMGRPLPLREDLVETLGRHRLRLACLVLPLRLRVAVSLVLLRQHPVVSLGPLNHRLLVALVPQHQLREVYLGRLQVVNLAHRLQVVNLVHRLLVALAVLPHLLRMVVRLFCVFCLLQYILYLPCLIFI